MYPFSKLPPRLSREIFAALRRALPPPHDDTQDALDGRDMIAMAAVAALCPRDAAEAMFAVQVVLAEAQARASLELAAAHAGDLKTMMQCNAQARAMMRQAQASLRGLQRLQATWTPPAEVETAESQADQTRAAAADTPLAAQPEPTPRAAGSGVIKPKPFGSDRIALWWQPARQRLADQNTEQLIIARYNETAAARAAVGEHARSAQGA